MIFAKISVFVLLVISLISTSESRHRRHCHKHRPLTTGCSCSSATALNNNNPNTNGKDIDIQPEINPDFQLSAEKTDEPNLPEVDKDGNLQIGPLIDNKEGNISQDETILNPLSLQAPYTGERRNNVADISPEQGSAMLKQYWVTRRIDDKPYLNPGYDQNNIKYPTNQINSIPSDSQATPYDQIYYIPQNHLTNDYNGQLDNAPKNNIYQTKNNIFKDNVNVNNQENINNKNNRRRYGTISAPKIDDNKDRLKPINLSDLSMYPKTSTPGMFKNNIPYIYNKNNMPVNILSHSQSAPQEKKVYDPTVQHDNSLSENYPSYVKPAPSQMFDFHIPLPASKNIPSTKMAVSPENYIQDIPYNNYDPKFKETHYRIPASYVAPHRLPSSQHEPGKFSKWVEEQIVLLNNKNQGTEKLDLSDLGYSILQILSENQMYLTDNGMLIDNDGTVSNIHSLTLTPVIIGNTIYLRNLLQGKYGMQPSGLQNPHLQAILVSATHPLKILGVLPLGTTNLPSSLRTTSRRLAPKQLATDDEDDTDDTTEAKITRETKEERQLKELAQSNNINVNGNENSVSLSRTREFSRRELRPDSNLVSGNLQYRKALKLDKDQSNTGRLFIPDIELHEQSINLLPNDIRRLNSLDEKYLILDDVSLDARPQISIARGSKAFDIAFRNEKLPANRKSKVNAETEPKKQSLLSTLEKIVHPTKEAILNTFNILKKEMPVSVDRKMILTRRLQIPVTNSPVYYRALPIEYDVLNNVPSVPDFNDQDRDYGYISRSGGDQPTMPDIPPPGNNNNGNNLVEIAENDDDDGDGDFRIIGGNAATGSGTPLNNKGRSGFIF